MNCSNFMMKIQYLMVIIIYVIHAIAAQDVSILQCKANCIDKFEIALLKRTTKYKVVSCISSNCKQCSQLCRSLSVRQNGNCTTLCSSKSSSSICESVCEFLQDKRKLSSKPGSCPKVLTGFDPALVARCHKDSDCPNSEKCCPNRRLKTCQNAKFTYSSNYPPVPVNVTAVVNSPSSAVVRWSMPSNSSWRGGTMFIIEKRYSFRRVHPSHSDFSFWSFAGETNELGTVVANLNPGDWYQFRIAAHSKEGSNGHSQPSPTIKMPSEVRKPGRARNFTANEAWLKNGLIFVNISWEAPLILDLPVRRYRLTYCKYVEGSGQHYDPVRVKRKKVSGKTTHVVLNGLHPDTLYKVKIQAIVISNRQRLRGRWGKMILRTPALKKFLELKSSVSPTVRLSSPAPPRVTENSVARVKAIIEFSCGDIAIKPNGYLSAVLRWTVPDSVEGIKIVYKANHCKNGQHVNMISKQRVVKAKLHHIVLTDLYPSCSYVAKMIPYYADRTADKERNISFSTAIDGTKPHKSKKAKTKKSKVPSRAAQLYFSYCFSFLIAIFNLLFLIL